MKRTLTLWILLVSIGLHAQLDKLPGTYFHDLQRGDQTMEYTLMLNSDGTFIFDYLKKMKNNTSVEHLYGKGKWTIDVVQNFSTSSIIVVFSADSIRDFDEKHQLDFNGSKARFIFKSQRNTSEKEMPLQLQFFESQISWMERVALTKKTVK